MGASNVLSSYCTMNCCHMQGEGRVGGCLKCASSEKSLSRLSKGGGQRSTLDSLVELKYAFILSEE